MLENLPSWCFFLERKMVISSMRSWPDWSDILGLMWNVVKMAVLCDCMAPAGGTYSCTFLTLGGGISHGRKLARNSMLPSNWAFWVTLVSAGLQIFAVSPTRP